MARYVDQGQRVSAGEALMKVDSKDAEEQVASAQSAVIASRAKADLAYSTLARYEKLHAANAISDLNMDQVRNQAQLAQAELDSSEAALSRAENNLALPCSRQTGTASSVPPSMRWARWWLPVRRW